MSDLSSLEKRYVTYSNYHKNGINRVIHLISIPLLFFTSSLLLSFSGPIIHVTGDSFLPTELNMAFVMSMVYSAYYTNLNNEIGTNISFIIWINQIICYWTSVLFPSIMFNCIILNALCWLFQFIGHFFFEKNTPAFLDGLINTLLIAPIVSYLDICELLRLNHGLTYVTNDVNEVVLHLFNQLGLTSRIDTVREKEPFQDMYHKNFKNTTQTKLDQLDYSEEEEDNRSSDNWSDTEVCYGDKSE